MSRGFFRKKAGYALYFTLIFSLAFATPIAHLALADQKAQLPDLSGYGLDSTALRDNNPLEYDRLVEVLASNNSVALKEYIRTLHLKDPNTRPPIRMSYDRHNCRTFYCPNDAAGEEKPRINESVGVPIANGTVEEFEQALIKLIEERGREGIKGNVFYVAGVDIRDEKKTYDEHMAVLTQYGLQKSVKIKVIPMPREELAGLSVQSAKVVLQRMAAWFPSFKKHYEAPTTEEVLWGLGLTALIESKNIYYLWTTMPTTDAVLTISSHSVVLGAYVIYTKFMVNWLLSPGSSKMGQFLKQLSLSLPFVINYNIFGNFTPMMEFVSNHTAAQSMVEFGSQMAEFATSQPLTLLLQTLFYWAVVTRTLGTWMNNVQGADQSADARVWKKVLETPALWLDAWILAIASGTAATVTFDYFGGAVNNGHLYLLTLTGASILAYKLLTKPTFKAYSWVRRKAFPGMKEFMGKALGVDIGQLVSQINVKSCLKALRRQKD